MAKKSIEYRLLYALNIAKANPDARILFAASTRRMAQQIWTTLMNLTGKPDGFKFSIQTRVATHEDGGSIWIRDIDDDNYSSICGMRVTHAFVDEWCTNAGVRYVSSCVRAPKAVVDRLKEPMGVYGDYFVTRYENY